MDRIYYFKELIALIVGLIIVLFPLLLRFVFYQMFRQGKGKKAGAGEAGSGLLSRAGWSYEKETKVRVKKKAKPQEDQFLKRIQKENLETIVASDRPVTGQGNVYPLNPFPEETRTPEDTVLSESEFDQIVGKPGERTPEDTVLPGSTFAEILNDGRETVLPQTALDAIFPESRENEEVLSVSQFVRRGADRREVTSQELRGWSRINRLPSLKRAIVLSEVLGPPKGLAE
jgi:hypothetical protein